MSIYEKLMNVQNELKAPKNQNNNFGGYKYRSCEDILEAVKPLLLKNKLTMFITDELTQVGDRYYIKATVTLTDVEDNSTIQNSAYAREADSKKGMSEEQLTGSCSSYCRKYALNGLFLIDDTKDADTDEYVKTTQEKKEIKATDSQLKMIKDLFKDNPEQLTEILKPLKKTKIVELTITEASKIIKERRGK